MVITVIILHACTALIMKSILQYLKWINQGQRRQARAGAAAWHSSQSLWVKTSIMTLCEKKEEGLIKSKEEQKEVM